MTTSYENTQFGVCYTLTLSHSGNGSDPAPVPTNSTGCAAGEYVEGETIDLTATPDSGWELSNWSGTDDDASVALTNMVTMPASDHTVEVGYDAVPDCTFSGTIDLQGRDDDSGATFTAGAYATTTDADGHYELIVPEGTYDVTAEMDLYLDGEQTGETCPAGGTNELTLVTLLGGDTNDDCIINILDLAFMGARFGLSDGDASFDAKADINADGSVNILDLTVAGGNFNKECPVAWP